MGKYTKEEDKFIRDNYLTMTDEEIGIKLSRTRYSVKTRRIRDLKLHRKRLYYSKKKHYTYNDVKSYIEIESNSGCKLISKEYSGFYKPLTVICNKCGQEYITTFGQFYKHGKYMCNDCSSIEQHNKLKHSYEFIKNYIEELGYILISDKYEGNVKRLTFSDSDGYFYYMDYNSLLQNRKPRAFYKTNPYTIQNIKLWCKLHNKPFYLISEEYISSNEKLQWKCLKENCGEIFEANWSHVKTNNGCGVCDAKQVTLLNCLATKNPELAREWNFEKNKNLTPYDVAPNSNKYAYWKCKDCKHEWRSIIADRNFYKRGCPACGGSEGEKKIKDYLDKKGFQQITQNEYEITINQNTNIYIINKRYNNLFGTGNGLLSYDFYLPQNYNLLIEYQGLQHYEPVDFEGKGKKHAEKQFEKQREHDRRKREYAHNHNINLLEIWYWEFDNIESILDKYFSNIKEEVIV